MFCGKSSNFHQSLRKVHRICEFHYIYYIETHETEAPSENLNTLRGREAVLESILHTKYADNDS